MPPKSSSAGWPGHGIFRTTARKRVPVVPTRYTSIPVSSASTFSSQDNHLTPPPPSTYATSLVVSQNDNGLLLSSPEKKSTFQTENSFLGESSLHVSSNAEPQEKALVSVPSAEIDVGYETQEKKLGDSSNLNALVEINPRNSAFADGPEVTTRDRRETFAEKAVVDAGGLRILVECGKRKVVKRVKVVKKVVKRVIKKVPKGSLKSLEIEGVGSVDSLNENIQNLESELNVSQSEQIEKVDPFGSDSVKDGKFEPHVVAPSGAENEGSKEPSRTSETERVDNVVDVNENIQNLESELNVSQSEQIEKVDPFGIESVKDGKFEPNDVAPLGTKKEGSKEIEVDSLEVENGGSSAKPVSAVGIWSGVPFADNSDGKEGQRIQNQIEDDKDIGDFREDQNPVQVEEGADEIDDVLKEVVGNNGAGLSGDFSESQNVVQVEEGAGEIEEVVKEFVGNNEADLNGVPVSREIEAVERRRQCQTEIFLGGLDKDTKEEDIRKVFQQVGEVTEVRLKMNSKTGKNKGFAFVSFASAADAKKALAKYAKVEICGKDCAVQPVEGNGTLFLGNINRKWKDHDVIELLKREGIEKIDRVRVKANPNNLEQNRGFAFVELKTHKDAQIAYNKLQKNYVFNEQLKIKVEWAQPDEKEMLKRKGFAFVTYTMREAALACIEAFKHEQVDEDASKVNVKVSLANPQKRSKQKKYVSPSTGNEHLRYEPKTLQSFLNVHGPGKTRIHTSKSHEVISDRTNSTTIELIHILRQQQVAGRPTQAGSFEQNYQHSLPGRKRTFNELDDYAVSSDPRGFLHTRRSSPLTGNTRSFPDHIGGISLPHFQQWSSGYSFESSHEIPNNPQFQTREQPRSFGHSHFYRRCM